MSTEKTFTLTKEQTEKFDAWRKDKILPQSTIGGAYTFKFTPTGIGTFVEVECADGTTLNLSEDNF